MDSLRTGRRAFAAFTLSAIACWSAVSSVACSSPGSAFDLNGGAANMGMVPGVGGMDGSTPSTPGAGTGSTSTGSTNSTGGVGDGTGGSGVGTAGSGVVVPTGGVGNAGGQAPQGGQAMTAGTASMGGGGNEPVCPKPAGQICHEFIANDNGKNQVNYVNEFTSTKPGGVVWAVAIGSTGSNSPRTIEIVDNPKASTGKAILLSVNTGYVELDLATGAKLAEVKAQFSNVTGACRLPDGTTALGVDNSNNTAVPAQIRIVNASGVQSRNFNLPAGANLRAINRDPATGHFWLSLTADVYELTDTGQIVWHGQMGAGTKGYAVWWREGGGGYCTTGEPATLVELDKAGQTLATIGGRGNFPDLALDFFSGFVRRPNGNYIVANWLGHLGSPGANTPHVIEFQPDGGKGKAIWTWGNQSLARQITNVYVLR